MPNPEQELERVRQVGKRGLPKVAIVSGPAGFFRAEALDVLLALVPADAELRTLDAGGEKAPRGGAEIAEDGDAVGDGEGDIDAAPTGQLGDEVLELRGGGLFCKRAFLCVRRGDAWLKRHGAALAAFLPKIATGCGLLVEVQKLDRRTKAAKALEQAGALFEFRDLYDSPWDRSRSPLEAELVGWIVQRARQAGVPLSPEAAFVLMAQVGKAPAELVAEIRRLVDQFGADPKRRPLAPDDLRGRLTTSFESNPFELAEAILANDERRATRSVRAMFDRGVRDRKGSTMDPGGVWPFASSWLFSALAQAYEGRQLLDSAVPARDLAGRLGIRVFQERFLEGVTRNTAVRLRLGLLALHECQRALRLAQDEPDVLFERFLAAWFRGRPVVLATGLDA
ncbi:MAG: hypothetical protein IPK26_14265 [Planctomycetes bacterium]|nr:hypothetical protein [Planctomycetota bacterium]